MKNSSIYPHGEIVSGDFCMNILNNNKKIDGQNTKIKHQESTKKTISSSIK